jgi:hypothetical protein
MVTANWRGCEGGLRGVLASQLDEFDIKLKAIEQRLLAWHRL